MTTAEEYMDLADMAYSVDPLRRDPPLEPGGTFYVGSGVHKQQYVVLDAENHAANGFQAMAVAPVVNGVPDLSQIVVSYAGTNPDHRADLLADVESIVGDQQGVGSQVLDAKYFADKVRKEHPGASISTAGHSLGAFLALLIGAEFGWDATTFNGPDPWEWLSPEAKKRLEAGSVSLHNYVNEWDLIGNLYANKTGAADYVRDKAGRPVLDYHNIAKREAFQVNPDGSIAGAGAKGHRLEDIVANALDTFAPGLAQALGPGLMALVTSLRNPTLMRKWSTTLSGVMVAVDTVSALGLAASIGGTIVSLAEIKLANGRLIPRLEEGLLAARTAVSMIPFVTAHDIENCVDAHRLHVRQSIDESAVAETDRLVDAHISLVNDIAEGISRAVLNTLHQDAQWALAYATG